MAQLTTVLPGAESGGILTACRGGPGYRTTVYDGATGYEARNQAWADPRRTFSLTFMGRASDVQEVVDLFDEAKGRLYSFLWTPPGGAQGDYRFGSDELSVETRASQSGDYITTVSCTVIEVINE